MPTNRPPAYHVSITALRLGSPLLVPLFWWHTARAARQARAAEGVLSVALRKVDGAWLTLTVWRDRASMRAFVRSAAHRAALVGFPWRTRARIAGFDADAIPTWHEVPDLLARHGRDL